MHREPLAQVVRRLGLSKELQKTNIVTSDREVLRLRREYPPMGQGLLFHNGEYGPLQLPECRQ